MQLYKSFRLFALIYLFTLGIVSCTQSKVADNPTQPVTGTVKELVAGDLLCYATMVDEKGITHNVGASFEICDESAKYLNRRVRASYEIANVSDCEGIEPCGKTRQESIISKLMVLE